MIGARKGKARLGTVILAAMIGMATMVGAAPVNPSAVRVIDGDTIELAGQSVRLVGFDTPETRHAKCDYERALGDQATARLQELIGSGALVDLVMLPGRDRYDRGLGRLFVESRDVGEILTSEGLARPYGGGRRQGWCG